MLDPGANHKVSYPVSDLLSKRLGDTWSVDRLAKVLGVSNRTVHRLFVREYGMSPMSLLRHVRLITARERLATSLPGTTVTEVALDCGFEHLGRFSQEYSRYFGESPSETLRQARRRPRPSMPEMRCSQGGGRGAPLARAS